MAKMGKTNKSMSANDVERVRVKTKFMVKKPIIPVYLLDFPCSKYFHRDEAARACTSCKEHYWNHVWMPTRHWRKDEKKALLEKKKKNIDSTLGRTYKSALQFFVGDVTNTTSTSTYCPMPWDRKANWLCPEKANAAASWRDNRMKFIFVSFWQTLWLCVWFMYLLLLEGDTCKSDDDDDADDGW